VLVGTIKRWHKIIFVILAGVLLYRAGEFVWGWLSIHVGNWIAMCISAIGTQPSKLIGGYWLSIYPKGGLLTILGPVLWISVPGYYLSLDAPNPYWHFATIEFSAVLLSSAAVFLGRRRRSWPFLVAGIGLIVVSYFHLTPWCVFARENVSPASLSVYQRVMLPWLWCLRVLVVASVVVLLLGGYSLWTLWSTCKSAAPIGKADRKRANRRAILVVVLGVVAWGLGSVALTETIIRIRLDKLQHSADPWVRKWAAESLCGRGETRVVAPLVSALKDNNPEVRVAAANSLGQVKDARAVEPLIAALLDNDLTVRRAVISALGEIRDARAGTPLLAALKDDDTRVRRTAARAFGMIKFVQAVEPLIALLNDKEPEVRVAAAKALGSLNDPRAIEALIVALKDDDFYVLRAAGVALNRLNYQPTTDEQRAALFVAAGKWDEIVPSRRDLRSGRRPQNTAPLVSDQQRDEEIKLQKLAVKPLLVALNSHRHGDDGVRMQAAETLGKIKDERAVEPLVTALKDNELRVRRAAALVLSEFHDTRAIGPLIQTLRRDDWGYWSTMEALAKIGAPALDSLATLLQDSDQKMRLLAIRALRKIQDARTPDLLASALEDTDRQVQSEAAIALTDFKDKRAIKPLLAAVAATTTDKNNSVRLEASYLLNRVYQIRTDSNQALRSANN